MVSKRFWMAGGLVASVLMLQGGWAMAEEAGNPKAGLAIATANCSRCHAIGVSGDSPLAAAPPFRTFAAKWPIDYLAEALAEGITVAHSEMPEFIFEPDQVSDILAYFKSVQPPPAP